MGWFFIVLATWSVSAYQRCASAEAWWLHLATWSVSAYQRYASAEVTLGVVGVLKQTCPSETP